MDRNVVNHPTMYDLCMTCLIHGRYNLPQSNSFHGGELSSDKIVYRISEMCAALKAWLTELIDHLSKRISIALQLSAVSLND